MRIVVAQMKHETNTFSPVRTDLRRFARGAAEPFYGRAACEATKGTGSAMAAFLDLAEAAGAEVVTPLAANAPPSGPVEDAAFEAMAARILEAVAAGCDAALLDLHGAMVTESLEDGEGELLRRLRAAAPGLPIAVALDMHANLYPAMVENATVIAGYQTYPHIDVYETGLRAGRVLLRALAGEVRPVMVWGNRPMLPHVMRQGSDDEPNRSLQAEAMRLEASGEALLASLFTGFPHADINNAGTSAVVVTDGDRPAAEPIRDRLLAAAWQARGDFVYRPEPLESALLRAEGMSAGPVILLDHYDNCASGGTMDSTAVLEKVLERDLPAVAVFGICDPEAVAEMQSAGLGARVTLKLGGKIPVTAMEVANRPLEITGVVRNLTDGQFRNEGPMFKGVLMDMGPTAVLDTGRQEIVVVSRQQEPNDLACFTSQGIEPRSKRYLLLKSRVHYRAAFRPLARAVVECAGAGVCTSDYGQLRFRRLRRPIFPLEPDATP